MKKEEIYLDLSKLSESERKEVFELLPPEKEKNDYLFNNRYNCLVYLNGYGGWVVVNDSTKTEITLKQFKELFNTIQLDKTKAYDLRDLNECNFQKIVDHLKEVNPKVNYLSAKNQLESFSHNIYLLCGSSDNDWYYSSSSIKKKVINALTLFEPQLKIGDTFEYNGFICEVKEPVKKWYYNKEFNMYIKTSDVREFVKEITDQEFINQLEKNAR